MTQTSNVNELANVLNLKVGPGYDREKALRAIDQAVSQIESILGDMEVQDRRAQSKAAFHRFMVNLGPAMTSVAGKIRIQHNVSWIKIESLVNGHKVYISKGKLAVGRVDSTLPPNLVSGARHAGRYNGRISSWIPADVESVGRAILLLGSYDVPRTIKKRS